MCTLTDASPADVSPADALFCAKITALVMSCSDGKCHGRGAADPLGLAEDAPAVADRDDAFMQMRRTQNRGRADRAPGAAAFGGGALRRAVEMPIAPSREDIARYVTVPGRYTPIGFARYTSPVVNPADYSYYRLAGWRVAIPRTTPSERVRDLLYRIFYYGPESAGYVRIGDTLVPAVLGPGDRMSLAGEVGSEPGTEYDPYPLSV